MSITLNMHVEPGQRATFVPSGERGFGWIVLDGTVGLFVPRDRTEAYEYLGSLIDAANEMYAAITQEAAR